MARMRTREKTFDAQGHTALWVYLFAYAVVLCLVAFCGHRIGNHFHETDFYWKHIPNARDLLNGVFPNYGNKMPLYSLLLAPTYLAAGDWFVAGRLLSIVTAVATLALVAAVVLHLTDQRGWAAFAAVLLISTNRVFFINGYEAGRDMLLLFLCTATIWVCLKAKSRRGLLLGGFLAALATLTRLNGLVLAAPLILRAGALAGWRPARWLRLAGPALLLFAVLFGSWPLAKYLATGSAALITTPAVNEIMQAGAPPGEMDRGSLSSVVLPLCARSLQRLVEMIRRDVTQVLGLPLSLVCAVLLPVAVFRLRRQTIAADLLPVAAFVVGSMAMLTLFHYERRYSMPYVFWVPLATVACGFRLVPAIDRKPLAKSLFLSAIIILAGINTRSASRTVARRLEHEPRYLFPFIAYLETHANADDRIVSFKPHIRADRLVAWQRLPIHQADSVEDLVRMLQENETTYFFYGEPELRIYSRFAELIRPTDTYPALTPVLATPHGVLYRVQGPDA